MEANDVLAYLTTQPASGGGGRVARGGRGGAGTERGVEEREVDEKRLAGGSNRGKEGGWALWEGGSA
eukprot:6173887-Pleurochrysis_carterae.AAC.3